MIRLEVIEMTEPSQEALSALRDYAAVTNPADTDLLKSFLIRAFDMVQRSADVALLSGRYRICCDDHSGIVRAYMGGKVEGVTNGSGLPVAYNQRGRTIYLGTDGYAEVEMTVEPSPADYARLLPVVLRYATALYDGKESRELYQILKEC